MSHWEWIGVLWRGDLNSRITINEGCLGMFSIFGLHNVHWFLLEASESVPVGRGQLVHVPPHVLAVLRVLVAVPRVAEVGDDGRLQGPGVNLQWDGQICRDEATHLLPVETLEPGMIFNLFGPGWTTPKSLKTLWWDRRSKTHLQPCWHPGRGAWWRNLWQAPSSPPPPHSPHLPRLESEVTAGAEWDLWQNVNDDSTLSSDCQLAWVPGELLVDDHVVQGVDVGVPPGGHSGHQLMH